MERDNSLLIQAKPGAVIWLGHCGEENARRVVFDFGLWKEKYGEGNLELVVQRPGEGKSYPVPLTIEGDTAIWTVTDADTAIPGSTGQAVLTYYFADGDVKSDVWQTEVTESLDEPDGTPPEPYQDWVDQVLRAGQSVKETVEAIPELVEEALTEAIPATVEAALNEAKESGEFDGPQGEQGMSIFYTTQEITRNGRIGWDTISTGGLELKAGNLVIDQRGTVASITRISSNGVYLTILFNLMGPPGEPGITPHIGENGNWFIGEADTGVPASGGGSSESGTVDIDSVEAEKVVFTRDMYSAYAIGNIVLENGRGKYASEGDNLADVMDAILDKENYPETTDPSVSLTFSQAKAYEVGTSVTPSYSAVLNPGSYTYGPDTGITATAWEITDTDGNKATTASGSFPAFVVADGEKYTITAKATHGAGAVPVTNKGNEYSEGQIQAGTKSATSGAVTGYRNSFYGTLTSKDDLTSAAVRGLTKSGKALTNGSSFTVSIPVGALRVVIAYPATLRDVTSIKDVNGMDAEIASSFVKQTLNVEGANGYTAISYKVYVLDRADANETANKYTVRI